MFHLSSEFVEDMSIPVEKQRITVDSKMDRVLIPIINAFLGNLFNDFLNRSIFDKVNKKFTHEVNLRSSGSRISKMGAANPKGDANLLFGKNLPKTA